MNIGGAEIPEIVHPDLGPMVHLCLGCALALIASIAFGYFWATEAPRRGTGLNVVVGLLTTAGVSLLSGWNVPFIGPAHGICWVLGFLLTTLIVRRGTINDHAAGLELLPGRIQKEFRAFVKCNLFNRPRSEADRIIKAKRAALIKEHDGRERNGTSAMHDFIHCARDESVAYVAARTRLMRELVNGSLNSSQLSERFRDEFDNHVRNVLEKALRLFQIASGDQNLWLAIRCLAQGTNGERVYKTRLRVGNVKADRDQRSVPIPENAGLPKYLREEYDSGRGVVVLGSKRRSDRWVTTKNDERLEDLSVMAGPIVLKSNAGGTEKNEMLMILYVNSDKADAFADSYRDILKCCTDTLSMFLSLLAQMDATSRVAQMSPLTISRT